ncbi:MAG: SDR family oxidoreductase [Proteobacteria bacterium]|nr:SDR family oxidoreductase [Pseudomonadota bacterium]
MRLPLNGTVLITGASSGIGEQLALQLAKTASAMAIVARRTDRLEELKSRLLVLNQKLVVLVQPCDLAVVEDAAKMIDAVEETLGPIDVLINNAGYGDLGLFEFSDWSKLEKMIQLNVVGLSYLTHRVLPSMLERCRGGILNVSSGFGLTFLPGAAAYIGTKHYVTSFTESLRSELVGTGVVVSQVCPGPVATEFEAVAGNPVDMNYNWLLEISADRCARETLAGFSRGRALIMPGWIATLLVLAGAWSPRWVLRLSYRWIGRWLRKKAVT